MGKHPFVNGCGDIPQDIADIIVGIQKWLKTQRTLPELTDEHVYMFLHSNYYKVPETLNTITSYFTIRSSSPEIFLNRSPTEPEIEAVWDMTYMIRLPKTTPEGYTVIMYKLRDADPEKFDHLLSVRATLLFSDIMVSEVGISPGFIMINDPRGFSLSHIAKTNFSILRMFMKYIQEAKPIRLKGLHVIYSSKIVDKLVSITKPFMKSELVSLLHIHSGNSLDSLYKYIPQDILPEDYGGKEESINVLHEKNRQFMRSNYVEWIAEEDKYTEEAFRLQGFSKKKSKSIAKDDFRIRDLEID